MDKSTLTTGPIFRTLFRFSLPMIIINILQMVFHTTDTAVLGIMSGDAEVAAIGACGSLISMLVCLVSGYSSAANVVISRRIGACDEQGARRATGTALVLGLLSGVLLMTEEESVRGEEKNCIRCAKCVGACPMGLEPYLLAKLGEYGDWERAENEDIMTCIECGCCTFTCPSNRPLLDWVRLAKNTVGGIIRERNAKK